MKFWEAMKALEEGKKVRSKEWAQTQWVEKKDMADMFGRSSVDEWELYEEPKHLFTFMQVLPMLRAGRRFRRDNETWTTDGYIYMFGSDPEGFLHNHLNVLCVLTLADFEATDWVEVK